MKKVLRVHPTNGCIEVKNVKNEDEAFALIEKFLNTHPDIDCDWVDGILIEED